LADGSSVGLYFSLKGLNILAQNIQQRILTHIDGGIYGVAGYFTHNDGLQHAVVAIRDGTLYEIHWSRGAEASSPQRLAHFNGLVCLAGFYSPDDNFQKVIVGSDVGNLHEVYFHQPQNPSFRSPLIHLKSVVGMKIGMAAFYTPDDNLRHAVIVDEGGELHEVFWSPEDESPDAEDFATQFDLNDISGIAGYYTPEDNARNIIVALKNGSLYDVHYISKQQTASTDFLTEFDGGLVNVAAFFAEDTYDRHIIVLNAKGDLFDYVNTPAGEVGKAQFASFEHIVDMAAYYSGNDSYRQIVVATSDGNIHEVCYQQ
jgi:hypothetical protein